MEHRELQGEELETEILKAMKEYVAEEMLKQGHTKEDLMRIEKEALDSLGRKRKKKGPDRDSFVGFLF